MGTAERWWRKGLSFAFVGFVVVAAVLCGLLVVGINTGLVPLQMGGETVEGPFGTLIGTAGIIIAFCAIVLSLALVAAVIYGLGFVLVGVAIFVVIAVLIGLMPVLAPVVLLGLGIWWLVRRQQRKRQAAPVQSPDAHGDPR